MDENKSTGMEECEIRHKHRSAKEEKDLISRLNRIEGQVRGVKAMVQDERYCTDILVQVSAIQSALNGFSRPPAVQPCQILRGGGDQKRGCG